MSKHTPGPWHYGGHLFDSRVMAKEAPTSWSTRTIAIVDHTEDEMGEANAHLIAAAPDLLEALESAHGYLVMMGTDHADHVRSVCRAAIAKARGK